MVQAGLPLTGVLPGQHPHTPWPSDVYQRGWNSNLDSPGLSPTFSSLSPRLQALINLQTPVRVVRCSHLPSEWYGTQSLSSADGRINKSIFIEHFLGARYSSNCSINTKLFNLPKSPYETGTIIIIDEVTETLRT